MSSFAYKWNKITRNLPVFSMLIILCFIVSALAAPLFSPHNPNQVNLRDHLLPPCWAEGGSMKNLLGTDMLGRDILTRILYGARTSLLVAALGIAVGGGIGAVLGILSGFRGGLLDMFLMRAADATMSFPLIFVALLLAVSLGPSLTNIVIAISAVLWARYARVIRGEVLSIKQSDFIALARVAGLSEWKIMVKHILPNILNTLVVMLTLQVGWVILVESMLSFLGAGVPPPTSTWGTMVARGREYIHAAWWITAFPGLAIVIVVVAFNLMGDWLRETLDPKMKQAI